MPSGVLLARVAAVLAAVPILVAAARALSWGWAPVGDEAVIATRALDVLSTQPPLVGQYSQASVVVGQPTYSPGPLPYWVLAVPAHLGPSALVVVTAAVNAACAAATVLLARRRGGAALAVAVALGLALVTRSLPPEAPYGIWNPYTAVFPFVLLLFVAWSVACGELALLPLLVVLATLVVQAHLSYVLPALGALAVAAAGAWIVRRGGQRSSPDPRRWVPAALAAGLVCWLPPLLDQAAHRPGNMVLLARSATSDKPKVGPRAGLHALERTVGAPPWWLRDGTELDRARDVMTGPGSRPALTALAVLVALAAVLVLAVRRRRHDVAAVSALGLLLCGAVALYTRSVPAETSDALSYSLFWGSGAGMFVWVTCAWGLWTLLAPAGRLARGRLLAGTAVAALAAAAVWVAAGPSLQDAGLSVRYADVDERVAGAVPDDTTVSVHARDARPGRVLVPAATYALRREGTDVTLPRFYADYFGAAYERSASPVAFRLAVIAAQADTGTSSAEVERLPGLGTITLRRVP